MSKYELTFVVNAKIEDDERAAVVDKCKALIERFGGTITNVDEWGKRRLAYEIQKMKEGFYYIVRRTDFCTCRDRKPYSHYGQRYEIFSC